jgi:hypothetical protein
MIPLEILANPRATNSSSRRISFAHSGHANAVNEPPGVTTVLPLTLATCNNVIAVLQYSQIISAHVRYYVQQTSLAGTPPSAVLKDEESNLPYENVQQTAGRE